jgi:hypothetical protein
MTMKKVYMEFFDCINYEDFPGETLFFECSFSQSFWWAIALNGILI